MPDYKRLVGKKIPTRRVIQANPEMKTTIVKAIFVLMLVALIIYLFFGMRSFVAHFPAFTIDRVSVVNQDGSTPENPQGIFDIDRLVEGSHLLSLDVNRLLQDIQTRHPELSSVVIRKQFPSTLLIVVKERKPIAIIGKKAYVADEEGFVLPFESTYESLPRIDGIDRRHVALNTRSHSVRLQKALILLRELKKTGISSAYKISRIDASDDLNIVFYLEDGIEIKMGKDNFKQKTDLLKEILARRQKEQDLALEYIDMRFDDPSALPQEN